MEVDFHHRGKGRIPKAKKNVEIGCIQDQQ